MPWMRADLNLPTYSVAVLQPHTMFPDYDHRRSFLKLYVSTLIWLLLSRRDVDEWLEDDRLERRQATLNPRLPPPPPLPHQHSSANSSPEDFLARDPNVPVHEPVQTDIILNDVDIEIAEAENRNDRVFDGRFPDEVDGRRNVPASNVHKRGRRSVQDAVFGLSDDAVDRAAVFSDLWGVLLMFDDHDVSIISLVLRRSRLRQRKARGIAGAFSPRIFGHH